MKLNTLFLLAALNWLLFGLGGLIAPQTIRPAADAGTLFLLRQFGAAVVVLAILAWLARGLTDTAARRAITLVLFLAYSASALFTIWGARSGAAPSSDIYYSIIDILLALGFGYYRFIRPE